MPLVAALSYSNDIKGTNSRADIAGEDTSEMSEVYEYEHKIYAPIDLNTGTVQGARVHGALGVTKPVDTATAPLYQALCWAETLDELILHFFRVDPSGGGTLEEFWTITMEGVKVASVRPHLPNVKDESLLNVPLMEDVEFLFNKITCTHVEGFELTDEWSTPV